MNIVEIASAYSTGKMTLLEACRKLDSLGYTMQEIRRVIQGVMRANELEKDTK